MDLLFRLLALLKGQQAAHYLAYDHGRGLEHLFVGGLVPGDRKVCAELIFKRTAHLVP